MAFDAHDLARIMATDGGRDLIQLCVHLEQMQRAGVPLLDALADVRDSTEGARLRDLSADDLAGALVDGIKDTSTAEQAAAVKAQTDQLLTIMKSIGQAKTGDIVTMDFVGGETLVAFNGQAKGKIAGEPLNAALMRIWLADKPVQADLRKAILGG